MNFGYHTRAEFRIFLSGKSGLYGPDRQHNNAGGNILDKLAEVVK